jgi:TIR domain
VTRIFINYRRGDTSTIASRLYEWLAARYGDDQVFMDVDTIVPGRPWREAIDRAVGSSNLVLAVIGKDWLPELNRRLADEDDFMRHELETALRRDVSIIPVLTEDARMPRSSELPESLAALSDYQAFELLGRFQFDKQELLKSVDRALGLEREVSPSPQPPPQPTVSTPAPTHVSPTDSAAPVQRGSRLRRLRVRWQHRRGRHVALAAGLLVIAGAAAVVVLAGRGDGGGSVFTWSLAAAVPGALGGSGHQEMHDVAAVGSNGAVAVGYDMARGRTVPAAWRYDSSEWARVKERFGFDSVGAFYGVAAQGQTVVAVGVAGPNDPASPEQDALVWTFSEGEWLRVCREACGNSVSGGGSRGQKMWDVVHRSGGGFVAVGSDLSDEDKNKNDAAVWTSSDGIVWSRVPADPEVFGGLRDQVMRAVTETRSDLLVAVGWDRKTGAVWTSKDGRVWTRDGVDAFGPLLESGFARLTGIIEEGSRLVTVGYDERGQGEGTGAAAWVSDGDPGEWQRIEPSAFSRNGEERALGGAATGHGTVAVGYEHPENESQAAVAWLLSGRTVRRIENEIFRGPGDREINAAAVLADGRLLAVGDGPSPYSDANPEQDARVWIATPQR